MIDTNKILNSSGFGRIHFSLNPLSEQKLSDRTFAELVKFIYDHSGIFFQDNKKYLLESRLQKRIQYLKLNSFENYFQYLLSSPNKEEEKLQLFEAITINETYFFRSQPQLDALVNTIIPEILENRGKFNNKLKIWSAGSSSGEEPYSIGIMVNEFILPKYPDLKVEIIGTDINSAVIKTAEKGIYKEYAVKSTPPTYLDKYFEKTGNTYSIDKKIREMVRFKLMNLYDDAEMKSMVGIDIIFCANVLIYFDLQSKIKVVNNLYNSLLPNGYLFIGYSETLHSISKAFRLVSFPKTIGYKKG